MPRFLKHLFGYMPTNLVKMFVAFGGVYVFTRLLGAEGYGRYALALSALHLLHTLTLTWTEAAGYRFAAEAEEKGRLPAHYRTSLVLVVTALVPSLLVLGFVLAFLGSAAEFRAALVWLVIILPVSVIVNLALENHRAGQRVGRYSAVEIGRSLGGFVLGAGLAWLGGFGAAAPLIGMAIAYSVTALTEGYWLWTNSNGGKVERAQLKRYAAYGLPVAAALVLDLVLSASDRFLIAFFIDEAAVGAYAAGYGVADKTVLMLCAWAAMGGAPLVLSAFEKGGKQAAEHAAKGMAQTMVLIAFPAAVGIAITAYPLSEVMIGEELRDQARRIIPWISIAGLLNGFLIYYFSEAFQLAEKTLERALIMIVPSVANIVLNIILLPRVGLMGAVYATVACYGLAVVLLALFGRRHIVMPIPLMDLGKVVVACAAMVGAVQLVPDMPALIELMVEAGVGALVYGLCVVSLDAAGARGLVGSLLGKVRSRLKSGQTAES